MIDPSCRTPCGATSLGGASSMCSEPSRLVWPIVAVALAGSLTLPLIVIVTSACQPWRLMSLTFPTVTSGNCASMVYAPGPLPWVPGSGNELTPRQLEQADTAATDRTASALAVNGRLQRAPITTPPRV